MIGYVTIGALDSEQSGRFYDAVFDVLGHDRRMEGGGWIAYGPKGGAAGFAFAAAWIALAGMMAWLRRASLTPFVIYRLVLGAGLLAFGAYRVATGTVVPAPVESAAATTSGWPRSIEKGCIALSGLTMARRPGVWAAAPTAITSMSLTTDAVSSKGRVRRSSRRRATEGDWGGVASESTWNGATVALPNS